jgi:hypothetical protein
MCGSSIGLDLHGPSDDKARLTVYRARMARAHRPMTRRLAVIVGTLGVLFAVAPVGSVMAATDKLPDLKVATTLDFRIALSPSGRRYLRFSGLMLNTGKGPIDLRAKRASTSSPWSVDQVVYQSGGDTRRIHTTATMGYAGDGHNHWHVLRMLTYHMYGPNQSTLKTAKIGFCFFDTNRKLSWTTTPRTRHYLQSGCATRNALSTHVGISVGWGDLYPDTFVYQAIEITGVPAGTYTVRGAIDLYGKFTELYEGNNCTWTRISFGATGTKVKVLAHGTSCVNDHDGSAFDADIDWALAQNVASNCDADMFCTNDRVTRGQFAQFVARGMDLPASATDHFTDDNSSPYEADIERVAQAGVMAGCTATTFCPNSNVNRGAVATVLATALDLPPADDDHFTDDGGSPDEANINRVFEAGIMTGCTATTFCPTASVKRGETMRFLHRAFGAAPAAVAPDATLASADSATELRAAPMLTTAGEDPADWILDPESAADLDPSNEAIGSIMDGSMGLQFACLVGP